MPEIPINVDPNMLLIATVAGLTGAVIVSSVIAVTAGAVTVTIVAFIGMYPRMINTTFTRDSNGNIVNQQTLSNL